MPQLDKLTRRPRHVSSKGILLDGNQLKFANEDFQLKDVVFVAINIDTDPDNGVAGAIDLQTRNYDNLQGTSFQSHRYVVDGKAYHEVEDLAKKLAEANVDVGTTHVANSSFISSFWGLNPADKDASVP